MDSDAAAAVWAMEAVAPKRRIQALVGVSRTPAHTPGHVPAVWEGLLMSDGILVVPCVLEEDELICGISGGQKKRLTTVSGEMLPSSWTRPARALTAPPPSKSCLDCRSSISAKPPYPGVAALAHAAPSLLLTPLPHKGLSVDTLRLLMESWSDSFDYLSFWASAHSWLR